MPKSSRTRAKRTLPLARVSLGLALLAALALRSWLATQNSGLTMDSPLYVRMSEAIRSGHTLAGPAHPGYPALVAVAGALVPGREWPGRAVSLLAGLALVVITYALARRRLSPGWSSAAAWLVALHPMAAVYSGAIMTEATLLALLYSALLLIDRERPLAGGAGLGLAWLVRPESLVVAPVAAALSRGGWRGAVLIAAGLAAFVIPYSAFLRWERGHWMLTPKTVLVRPMFQDRQQAEWRLRDSDAVTDTTPLAERARRAAPSVVSGYLPRLARHAGVLLESWSWPLMLFGLAGLALGGHALLAPLILTAALPLVAVPSDARFALLTLPALAVLAAAGASWLAARLERPRPLAPAAASVILALGIAMVWWGPAGQQARWFDDGPMPQMREAGEWLRLQGAPGARVMDRKAYVPFFAGAEHVQFPNDDYDTVLDYARREGVDYLVFEEYLVPTLRPQFLPLVQDREFRVRERRVRLGFATGLEPMTGVAVFAVVRDSTGAGGALLDAPLPRPPARR